MKKKLFLCLLIIISLLITKNVQAETYNGEYSIEYLLKNYNVVTLGQKDIYTGGSIDAFGHNYKTGDLYYNSQYYNSTINGSILVSGNVYRANYTDSQLFLTINSNQGIKSYIKGSIGNDVVVTSQATDSNYLDFNKMYLEIMKESQTIADNTDHFINSKNLEVSAPGIYTIQNTASLKSNRAFRNNTILIKNYDRNSIYIFNYYNEFVYDNTLPNIMIMESNSSNAIYLTDYINTGNYTGNIIFNFPNAKRIDFTYNDQHYGFYFSCYDSSYPKCEGLNANIVAPNADVYIEGNSYFYKNLNFYGSIISNSLRFGTNIQKANYNLDRKIVDTSSYIVTSKDFSDDYYSRDYSIKDLLENYSLITLGHKPISSNAKLAGLTNKRGSARIFHITGQALINGDMVYDTPFVTAFDLQSNKVTESYIEGNAFVNGGYNPQAGGGYTVIQPWDNMDSDTTGYLYQKNSLFLKDYNPSSRPNTVTNMQGLYTTSIYNYINFDRLYENIVTEQSGIEAGKTLSVDSDGILHIPTGGIYTIEDISSIEEIIFDDFEKNKDELTIITIKNEGDINFPLISKNENMDKAIITNDYFGKEKATHRYELDTFLSEDSYYGNIVWNLPNADYIKLEENAPFAGHMIAPNADVETPELHFAGCFIVNSIYGEGNTEAHFYPINSDCKCVSSEYDSLSKTQKMKFNDYRLRKSLGGDKTTIEKEIIGDKAQYDKDVALFESLILKCDNREIIINPETAGTIAIILGLLTIGSITLIATRRSKKSN
ncbi:MAG: choice-of-anchor A family protein [Bacilli bacterium]|nr:choice-of-anchor A family protein [Bacilli bacterium]